LKTTGLWGGFSATAYFFAEALQKEMKEVPIGLIASSSGGSRIEPWTTEAGWKSVPELAKDYQKMKSVDLKKAKAGIWNPWPSLYNVAIYPIVQMPIKGVIWYQGEANRKDGMKYFHRMQALINGWRQHWGAEMPFYFVQLAPFSYEKDKSDVLPGVWLAQSEADEKINNVGMAVTIDIGNPRDIHPKNKKEVGRRLALLALKDTYGKEVLAYSPVAVSAQPKKGTLTGTFNNVGGGLVLAEGKDLAGFEVAGEGGVFKPATANIVAKDKVAVFSKDVSHPIQVRYAWKNTPEVNLKSKEGLPVPCFLKSSRK
jgi:sialate O-acetylesterase